MQVRGAVPGDFSSVFDLAPKEGSLPSGLDQAAIGEGTALLTGWKPGDIIRVFGRDFTITGIASAPGTKASSIWITLDAAEALFSSRGIFQFAWIKLNPGVDAEQTKETLIANPRIGTDYDVFYVDHLYDQYTRGLADVITVCNVLVALALLIIMFGTYGSSFLLLAERRREITILRAIGFTAESVQGILVWRTIVQLIAAYLAAWGISAYLLERISRIYPITVHAIPLDVVISVKILLGGLLLSLFFGILGVLLSTMHLRKGSVRSFIER
jgi:ABC-type lipoprotein release transport system permease subunit